MGSQRLLAVLMVQKRIENLESELEFEKERLKAVLQTMTDKELEYITEEHYKRKMFDYPLAVVYANNELVKREDAAIEKLPSIKEEEVPF